MGNTWLKVPEDTRNTCSQIEKSFIFTEEKLKKISEKIHPYLKEYDNNISLVLAGSIGRKEAHATSDVDAFFIFGNKIEKDRCDAIREILIDRLKFIVESSEIGLRMASQGAFSNSCFIDDVILNIGGKNDTNDTLTRRILLLTEGYGIPQKSMFKKIRENILRKYLADIQSSTDRRPIFLLNDVIRYYRTMCVDYEYKKNEKGKPWAVRLTKLRHSRKLLYFSALLPLIESIDMKSKRINWLREQFEEYTPLERIILLLNRYGEKKHWDILKLYDNFLSFLASKVKREQLDEVDYDRREKNISYIEMRDNARKFRALFNDFILSVEKWQEPIRKYVLS